MPGPLDRIGKRLGGRTDEQLRAEIDEQRERLRAFRREHARFRERAHAAVDESVAAARTELDRMLATLAEVQVPLEALRAANGSPSVLERLGALASAASPELAAAWHKAVDAAEGFSPLTRAQFTAEEAKLAAEVRDREVELERRQVAAAKAAAEQELAALEQRAGAA